MSNSCGELIVREVGHRAGVLYRPVNETAVRFVALLSQSTLTRQNVEDIRALGFVIKVTRLSETEEVL